MVREAALQRIFATWGDKLRIAFFPPNTTAASRGLTLVNSIWNAGEGLTAKSQNVDCNKYGAFYTGKDVGITIPIVRGGCKVLHPAPESFGSAEPRFSTLEAYIACETLCTIPYNFSGPSGFNSM